MWVVPQKKVRLHVFLFREWGKLCHKKPGKKHTLLLMSAYETKKYTEGPFKWWRLKLSSGSRKHRIQIKGGLLIQDIIRTHRLSLAEDVTIEGEFFLFFFLQTSAWHTHTRAPRSQAVFQCVLWSRRLHNIIKQFKLALLTQALNAAVSRGGSHQRHQGPLPPP